MLALKLNNKDTALTCYNARVKKYLLISKLAFQDIFEYRFDFVMHALKYSVAVLMMSLVWIAVSHGPNTLPFSTQQTVFYYACAAVLYSLSNFHPYYVEDDIRLGTLSKYLVKPISPFWYYFAFESTRSFVEVVVRAAAIFPLFWLFGLTLSLQPLNIALFLIFLPIIFFCMFSLFLIISECAFWVQDVFAIRWSLTIVFRFLSGILVPIAFFPNAFQRWMFYLPFEHMAYTPIQIIQNQVSTTTALQSLGILIGWTVIISAVRIIVWQKGVHQYEGAGI